MILFEILSLFIHLYTYGDIVLESEMTTGYPVLVIDDPVGAYIFLTPTGTLMNVRTLPDIPVLSYKPFRKVPARWEYIDHYWIHSPHLTIVISPPGTSRIILSVGSLIALF